MARHYTTHEDHRSHSQAHTSREHHHSSSAFSSSAQPDEDWTKITDLAERRRIQNRIAQRNYRKKLKRKMEDMEKKESSTSSSPEPRSETLASGSQKSPRPSKSPRTRSPSLVDLATSQATDEDAFYHDDFSSSFMGPLDFAFSMPDQTPSYTLPLPQMPTFSCVGSDNYTGYDGGMTAFDHLAYQEKLVQPRADSIFDYPISSQSQPMSIAAPFTADYSSNSFDLLKAPSVCDMYDLHSAGSPGELGGYPVTPAMAPLSPQFVSFEL